MADAGITVDPGVEHRVFITDNGEQIKTLGAVEELCREFAQWGLTRRDAVVAVGGGAVTDLGGFAAAIYHRGIRVVFVSTTLLGQIDASVGGKTGVNLPEGKNLVGAFWQPSAVLCDTEALDTLPPEEMRSGLGEMAKYHFIADADLDALSLPERIARCVQIKAEVVAADERVAYPPARRGRCRRDGRAVQPGQEGSRRAHLHVGRPRRNPTGHRPGACPVERDTGGHQMNWSPTCVEVLR